VLTASSSVPPRRAGHAKVRPTRRWWPVLLPLALLVIGASVYLPAGRHQWALSLFRQPTPYTVLAFNRVTALPTQAVINHPMTVSFGISNREGRTMNYRYVLTQSPSKTASVLRQSTETVAAGATWNVSATIRPSCQTSPCRIQVSLPGHPEIIDFLVRLGPARPRQGR
jgi:hypothetical protein